MALMFASTAAAEDLLMTTKPVGRYGGDLIVAERSEPKTLNPVTATDGVSRDLIQLMTADLVHINRETQETEPALARFVSASADRRRYTLQLRHGIRFSDGMPFDADDIVFTFQVYLDEKIHSPQRDLLLFNGSRPVSVHKVDAFEVAFEFSDPYAPGDRLFDNIAILPRHLLLKPYLDGTLIDAWGINARPHEIAGLGPFRLKEQIPGQRIVLERNPYYWKQDSALNRLPYLRNVIFEYAGSEDGQVLRFQTGASDVISRPGARSFELLSKSGSPTRTMVDLGPGLEYSFLFFNLNDVSRASMPQLAAKQAWFREVNFRRAVSAAIDRGAIARIVYAGRATPIWTHVTPGNKLWINSSIVEAPRSVPAARSLLAAAGFTWNEKGLLLDRARHLVEFSIVTSSGNNERAQMATIIQRDLEELGMTVHVVSLEFRSMLDRITKTLDYDACILGLVSGDVDPGSEMNVWPSSGSAHFWNLHRNTPATAWEAEIDRLMAAQMVSLNSVDRKNFYDRVQRLISEYLPVVCLISPNVLAGARTGLKNFRPTILPPHILWNAEELYWQSGSSR
jgi:peptide/nickel transport system substrate-binding protein